MIVIGIAGVIIIVMAVVIAQLHRKINRFIAGSTSIGLDDSITNIKHSIGELEAFRIEFFKERQGRVSLQLRFKITIDNPDAQSAASAGGWTSSSAISAGVSPRFISRTV